MKSEINLVIEEIFLEGVLERGKTDYDIAFEQENFRSLYSSCVHNEYNSYLNKCKIC